MPPRKKSCFQYYEEIQPLLLFATADFRGFCDLAGATANVA
jgi:hypothetical protein